MDYVIAARLKGHECALLLGSISPSLLYVDPCHGHISKTKQDKPILTV